MRLAKNCFIRSWSNLVRIESRRGMHSKPLIYFECYDFDVKWVHLIAVKSGYQGDVNALCSAYKIAAICKFKPKNTRVDNFSKEFHQHLLDNLTYQFGFFDISFPKAHLAPFNTRTLTTLFICRQLRNALSNTISKFSISQVHVEVQQGCRYFGILKDQWNLS